MMQVTKMMIIIIIMTTVMTMIMTMIMTLIMVILVIAVILTARTYLLKIFTKKSKTIDSQKLLKF